MINIVADFLWSNINTIYFHSPVKQNKNEILNKWYFHITFHVINDKIILLSSSHQLRSQGRCTTPSDKNFRIIRSKILLLLLKPQISLSSTCQTGKLARILHSQTTTKIPKLYRLFSSSLNTGQTNGTHTYLQIIL